MGHRIAVLLDGRLQQVGAPYDLYRRPANTFVASFLGSPGMNLLAATAHDGHLRVGDQPLGLAAAVADGPVTVGARAEQVRLATDGLEGLATAVEVLGADVLVFTSLSDGTAVVARQAVEAARPAIGEPVRVALVAGEYALFDAVTTRLLDPVAR
jgi:ABC-type sugar transport system ATPase subunit